MLEKRWFFVAFALVLLALVLAGFTPTLYLRPLFDRTDFATGSRSLPPHLLVHGIVITSWYLLLVAQTWLVAAGRTKLHRRLGVAGVVAAIAVVGATVPVTVNFVPRTMAFEATRGTAPADVTAFLEAFLVSAYLQVVMFASYAGAAVLLRRRPATHKRLMLLASVLLVGPAFASNRPVAQALASVTSWDPYVTFAALCIGALAWYDLATRRRLEPATLWGGAGAMIAIVAMDFYWLHWAGSAVGAALVRWSAG